MNILAICAALNNSYLAIEYENKIISEIIKSDENYHSLYLIQRIKTIAKENSIDLKKLDAICVNCGPGSFTGIRVALTIAKIISGELNLPLISLNTAEILLNAFKCDLLLMDARRDMFFVGTKEKIELVYKDRISEIIKDKKILTDLRCKELSTNSLCYEETEKNLGEVMLKLAYDKYNNSNNKDEFNYLAVEANYIQTPPVFN